MTRRVRRPSAVALLAGALLVCLPALAVLQYRWLGQLSAAERARMQSTLEKAAAQFGEDFDLEITRAYVGLQIESATVRDAAWDQYAHRYDAWAAAAIDPALVREVWLVDAGAGVAAVRLQRWNAARRTFEPADWPADLVTRRAPFERLRQAWTADPRGFPNIQELVTFGGDDDSPLLAPAVPARPSDPPVFAWTMVRLDAGALRNRLLPTLVKRHFGSTVRETPANAGARRLPRQLSSTDGPDYHVTVTHRADAQRVIYRSDHHAGAGPTRPDATVEFFGINPRHFVMLRQVTTTTTAAAPAAGRAAPGAPGESRTGRNALFITARTGGGPGPRGLYQPRWRLALTHRAGSLEAAVQLVRRRNLLVSFGILALMAITVGLLALTAGRAQRLARQQLEFVAGVSHELRTPVSVISAAAENLADGLVADSARVRTYGEAIRTETRRLADMVERVLQFAGIQAGRGIGRRVPLDVGSLVAEAIAACEPVARTAGARVEADIAQGLPTIAGDAGALRAAVQNLIANAVKYGTRGQAVHVEVRGVDRGVTRMEKRGRTRHQGPAREVAISVQDHGPGIAARDRSHIFEPFYRGADAAARQIQGTGLGLSIAKHVIEAHGGRLTVASAPGDGSTFTIHLPVMRDEVVARAQPAVDASPLS